MAQHGTGLILGAIGTLCGGLGDNLVRKAYAKTQVESSERWLHLDKPERVDAPAPCCSTTMLFHPLWIVGWTLTLGLDTGFTLVALYLAPLEEIAPLGATHILWASVFAFLVNGEVLRTQDAFGAVCVLLGLSLVLAVAPGGTSATPAVLADGNCQSSAAALLGGAAVCGLLWRAGTVRAARIARPAFAGICGAASNSLVFMLERMRGSHPVMLSLTAALALCAPAQLWSLNSALAASEACVVVPVYQATLLLGASFVGVTCFDASRLDIDATVKLVCGMSLCCVGICVVTTRPPTHQTNPGSPVAALTSGTASPSYGSAPDL
eukprot:TRINITY_DN35499_c0_g1_i1.p1 TRINITY_DN35499_c0_g1~~TRINITY_DN35499_c0_g1_i1.p1  ORF type:complete len:323 (+),score=63.60 TRINITY_DN35499_c0_g1_i1:240-1208(+)